MGGIKLHKVYRLPGTLQLTLQMTHKKLPSGRSGKQLQRRGSEECTVTI